MALFLKVVCDLRLGDIVGSQSRIETPSWSKFHCCRGLRRHPRNQPTHREIPFWPVFFLCHVQMADGSGESKCFRSKWIFPWENRRWWWQHHSTEKDSFCQKEPSKSCQEASCEVYSQNEIGDRLMPRMGGCQPPPSYPLQPCDLGYFVVGYGHIMAITSTQLFGDYILHISYIIYPMPISIVGKMSLKKL